MEINRDGGFTSVRTAFDNRRKNRRAYPIGTGSATLAAPENGVPTRLAGPAGQRRCGGEKGGIRKRETGVALKRSVWTEEERSLRVGD